MPIHVHMMTQVKPRIETEWKFLCSRGQQGLKWNTVTKIEMREHPYLQLLRSPQSKHVLDIFARPAGPFQRAVAVHGTCLQQFIGFGHGLEIEAKAVTIDRQIKVTPDT